MSGGSVTLNIHFIDTLLFLVPNSNTKDASTKETFSLNVILPLITASILTLDASKISKQFCKTKIKESFKLAKLYQTDIRCI